MANNIDLIVKYSPDILDDLFRKDSVTAILEGHNNLLRFVNAKTVMIPDMVLSQLGKYDREGGFSKGTIEVNYVPYTLTQDRGTSFEWDAMDAEESVVAEYPIIQANFIKEQTVPQVDSYRLSTLRGQALPEAIVEEAVSTNDIIKSFNTAIKYFADMEAGTEDAVLFVSTEVEKALKETPELTRQISQMDYKGANGITFKVRAYEGIPIVPVPKPRFKTEYNFTETGFEVKEGATDINFMLVHKKAALPISKHRKIRYFAPDDNLNKDAHKFDYRLYHDIITPKNKKAAIYVSEVGGE